LLAVERKLLLQLVVRFVLRIAKHSCHDPRPKRIAVVFADEALVVNVVVGFDI
jgi:hypothetical protein